MGRKKLLRKAEPRKLPPEMQARLEQQPKSRWRPTKNQVVRATEVAVVISIIWILWRDVIRVGGNSNYVLRALFTVVGIWILIRIGSLYEWTGFGERALEKSRGQRNPT